MKNISSLLLLICLICNLNIYSQVQIGQDLDGESILDYFGYDLAYSNDGNIVAIGAPRPGLSSETGSGPGSVEVFFYIQDSWVLMGQKLEGINFEDREFGTAVALSSDGLTLAVGSPGGNRVKVYNFINDMWVQLGANIEISFLNNENPYFGGKVSLSDNGYILSVGASGRGVELANNVKGYVRSYEYNLNNDLWEELGSKLKAVDVQTQFGAGVSLSSNGNRLAVLRGADISNPSINPQLPSAAIIYEYNGNEWQQIGNEIIAFENNVSSAELKKVSFTNDGLTVAIGSRLYNPYPPNTGSSSNEGGVQVYTFNGVDWIQKGQDIIGIPGESLGSSVSLSNNGTILAIGSLGNDKDSRLATYDSGSVKIFKFHNEEWKPIGDVIYGESFKDQLGRSVRLSGDGNRVAIGARNNASNTGNINNTNGHVIVYDISSILLSNSKVNLKNSISTFPNPTKDIISVKSTFDIQSIEVYSVLGELLFRQDVSLDIVNLKSYPDGLFFFKIISKKSSVIKRVIKKS